MEGGREGGREEKNRISANSLGVVAGHIHVLLQLPNAASQHLNNTSLH